MTSRDESTALPVDVAVAMKEYESVRQEEIMALQSHVSTLRYGITGCVILFGIAAQQHADKYLGWAIALALLPLVIMFSAVIWMGEYERMARAGRYVALLEKQINDRLGEHRPLRWESWLREGGNSQSRLIGGHHRYLMIICVFVGLQIAAVSMGLHFYWHKHAHDPSREWLIPVGVGVNLAILLTLLGYFRSSYERLRDFTSDPEEQGRRVRSRFRIRVRLYGTLLTVGVISAPIYSWPLGLAVVHWLNGEMGGGVASYWSAAPTALWMALVPMLASRAVMHELLLERIAPVRAPTEQELETIETAAGDLLTDWERAKLRVVSSTSLNSPSIGRTKNITITSSSLTLGPTLRGPLAHEIGHHRLQHLHPLAISYLYLWPYLYYDREIVRHLETTHGLRRALWMIARAMFTVLALPGWLAWVLIRVGWRTSEYDADRFACQIGAHTELAQALDEYEKARLERRPRGARARIRLGLARIEQGRALGYLPLPNEHPIPVRRRRKLARWVWRRRPIAQPPEGNADAIRVQRQTSSRQSTQP